MHVLGWEAVAALRPPETTALAWDAEVSEAGCKVDPLSRLNKAPSFRNFNLMWRERDLLFILET